MYDFLYDFLHRAFFFGFILWAINVAIYLYKTDRLGFWVMIKTYAIQGLLFSALMLIFDKVGAFTTTFFTDG